MGKYSTKPKNEKVKVKNKKDDKSKIDSNLKFSNQGPQFHWPVESGYLQTYESFLNTARGDNDKVDDVLLANKIRDLKSPLKTSKEYLKIPLNIYYERFFDVFYDFFDAIKTIDDSIYFWVYGGCFRKILHNHRLTTDIDIYTSSYEDFQKLSDILLIMGWKRNKYDGSVFSHSYTLFGHNNLSIDLILPHSVLGTDHDKEFEDRERNFSMSTAVYNTSRITFLSPQSTLYWTDFTNSSVILDSNYDLFYLNEFFTSVETRVLDIPRHKDIDLLYRLLDEHEICKENPRWAYITKKLVEYLVARRVISKHYYRTRKFLREQNYHLEGDNIKKYVEASSIPAPMIAPDLIDGMEEEAFYINLGKIFEDIFFKNPEMIKHLNKIIKKVNLFDIFVEKK